MWTKILKILVQYKPESDIITMRMLIFVLCIYSTAALAMEKEEKIDGNTYQSISISKKDVKNLTSAFKGKLPLHIMTVGINHTTRHLLIVS
ncbi:MAG: hypothetical protein H0X26_08570 [Alphaproteobacteria bacterium]|nr:hypothetical protein [Alphaproteobacteria bacterium]